MTPEAKREALVTVAALVSDVSAGLRVLRTRDGVPLTEAQVSDRARNIVAGLIGNYRIERLDGVTYSEAREAPDFTDERIK